MTAMDVLDELLGRFAFWRRLRGGVWEGWLVRAGRLRWFGPFRETYRERIVLLDSADPEVIYAIRYAVRTKLLETDDLRDIAKPSASCIGHEPLTEDRRP